jgi:hypothetical protein
MKNKFSLKDYLKANRKASRELEIEIFHRPLVLKKVHQSKRTYNRKHYKAGSNDLPFSFLRLR